MAKYTIELRNVCDIYTRNEVESWFKDYEITDYLLPEFAQLVENTGVWSKDKLAKKIVDHYYMREIAFETPALFKHYAKVKMQEIMERYLMIVYTNCIEYDPFESVDFHITESRTINNNSQNSGTSSTTTSSSGSGLQVNSNTPQGQISKASILAGDYATSTGASESEASGSDSTTTSQTGSGTTVESFSHDERGNKGVMDSYQKLIIQLRETIYAVDEEIIKELNPLFFGLY